jgi:glycosyltransferase involved in cell wall biosynthesis
MGPGDAEAPGRIMRALDLALAPYVDGLTLRRTGAMLALAHGVATVSSRGPLFDPLAGELADCLPTAETFAERVAVLGRDEAARRELASRAARFSELASVDVAARRLVSDLAEPKR